MRFGYNIITGFYYWFEPKVKTKRLTRKQRIKTAR